MKNEKTLINLIDLATLKTIDVLKKLGKLINNKNSHDTVFIFTKIIITFIVIALLNIPTMVLRELGTMIIYMVGNTFRHLLSSIWSFIVYFSYFFISLMLFLKVFNEILKDKELNLIEKNRRKDTIAKKKIFLPIIDFVKTCIGIITIPVIIVLAVILMLFGMSIALFINGIGLISILLIVIGLFVMIMSPVLIIFRMSKNNGGDN